MRILSTMRSRLVILAIGAVLVAGPVSAGQAAKPAAPAPKPTAAPAAPAQTPPAPAPAAAPAPPVPFPEGAKIAYINLQRVASESADGQQATKRITTLREEKEKDLVSRNAKFEEARKRLETSASVLSEAVRGSQQKDVERLQTDLQRATQDAQKAVEDLQTELQVEFEKRLRPILSDVASSKNLHMVFSQADSGVVWANPGLDITGDVIKRLDAAAAAGPKP
jgi:Skp family chaperone for outer membrane proteins